MMRKCIVAGNWKLNNTIAQSEALMKDIVKGIGNMTDECEVVVCPPFTAIKSVADMVANTEISVGGQDLYWQASGAFTGEVSCEMLKEAGCTYVIIGHSERRTLFHESNENVSSKVQAAIDGGLLPIVCVGETLEQRQGQKTESHISEQVKAAFSKVIAEDVSKIVVAYEPIWAIGTGMAASAEDANEVACLIRSVIAEQFSKELAEEVRVQYGGSVKASNMAQFASQPGIDGALVGGASLNGPEFLNIIREMISSCR